MSMPPRNFRLNTKSIQAKGLVGWWPIYSAQNAGQRNHLIDHSLYSSKLPFVAFDPSQVTTYFQDDTFGSTTQFTTDPGLIVKAGYVPLGNPPYLSVSTGAIALSCWVQVLAVEPGAPPPGEQGLISISSLDGLRLIGLHHIAGGQLEFGIGDGAVQIYQDTVNVLNTGWRHFIGMRGGGRVQSYLDGKQIGNTLDTTGNLGFTTEQWNIGYWDSAGSYGGSPCSLQIADLRIYKDVFLTQKFAQHLYAVQTRFDLCLPL